MGGALSLHTVHLRIHAPMAGDVVVEWQEPTLGGAPSTSPLRATAGGFWTGSFTAAEGARYWLRADDGPALVDPSCRDLVVTPEGPRSVVRAPC